jgi:hypothetical protein
LKGNYADVASEVTAQQSENLLLNGNMQLFDNLCMDPDCTETRRHSRLAKGGSVRNAGHTRRGKLQGNTFKGIGKPAMNYPG